LLLDTNDPANPVPIRLTTGQLYGGDSEMRLRQELVLGIGGWRMLLAAGVEPDICHLNDGHAALAVLERARSYMQAHDVSFQVALAATRPGNLFTTHTPVAAGFDRFAPALIARYLGGYAEQELGLSLPALLALGRQHAEADAEPFNMAYLAVRCAGAVNAVSSLHGQTSRDIFQGLFPRWPTPEVPVGHVTNGVHLPMWMSWRMRAALSPGAQAEDCIGDGAVDVPNAVAQASDGRLWDLRNQARTRLIVFARAHQARSRAAHGDTPERIASAGQGLDPHRLTVGFARRFASYKRPNLLLSDPERLLRLLNHPKRPLQLLVAGKAHPADLEGQQMLQRWHAFTRQAQTQGRVVLLQDYEVRLARHLIQGVDLWLNTPRRPWEASGTSGMKVLANGGLNLSQRDGWWAEACEGEVGWSIGDGEEHDASHDAIDAEQLYTVLEEEVVPAFYQRDAEGLPQAWLRRMRRSMSELVPRFTAERAVRDYTERYYLPGASAHLTRTTLDPGRATRLAQVSEQLRQHWPQIRFGSVQVQPGASAHQVELSLETGAIAPEWLQVQMYADGIAGQPARVLALEAVPARVAVRYGLVTQRADLRTFPTTRRVFSTTENHDIDRFQESALFPGDAVAVLHESRDRQWLFVTSERYSAWIEKRHVGLGSAQQVFGYGAHGPYRVITGATATTVFTPEQPQVSQLQLDMGVRVPVIADWNPTEPVNGQLPYTGWVIQLPIRNDDGSLRLVPALLPRTADTSAGYLPLTPRNLITQGFKFLGERYGWGHAYDARDCSGFTSEIYRSFGVLLPRNTSQQAVSPALDRIAFDPSDPDAKRTSAVRQLAVGDMVYIPGHVMVVLGHVGALTYVIHDTAGGSWLGPDGARVAARLNGVSVTPLEPMLASDTASYIDRITNIQRVRPWPATAKQAE